MINDTFGAEFLATVNDSAGHPVHLLFNKWWNEASAEAKNRYVEMFRADPGFLDWYETGFYSEPLDLDALAAMPDGSLGRAYRDWIVDNGLTAQIALDYRDFHRMLEASGTLDGMPDEMKYAVLRGFQVHDFLHVLTGYDSSGAGEIALQAFSLAQFQFPYFGMWMAVVTAQMTFNQPDSIVGLMDAISDGWQYGRATRNLAIQPWESMLEQPLTELRDRFDVELSPLATTHAAAHAALTTSDH